jgi:hypothetical protein
MPWARLDDGFHQSRKIRRLSAVAFRLYVSAICDCCKESSDGIIDGEALRELLPRREFHENHITELVSAGLLHDSAHQCESDLCLTARGLPVTGSDAYVVHDFGEWQMTTDEWSARKAASEKANHTKWHVNKKVKKQGCRLCYPVRLVSDSDSGSDSDLESRPDLT